MTVNSSATSVILILFMFLDNLSAENSKSSADFCIQRIQLLECMAQCALEFIVQRQGRPLCHKWTKAVSHNEKNLQSNIWMINLFVKLQQFEECCVKSNTAEILQVDGGCSHLDLPVAPLDHTDGAASSVIVIILHLLSLRWLPCNWLAGISVESICHHTYLVSGVDSEVDGAAVLDPHLGDPGPVLVQHRPLPGEI